MSLPYIISAAVSDLSQPQTAGDIQPQPWVIIIVLLAATGFWFFTRNRRR